MICVFEITSDESLGFKRVVQINQENTFEDLHKTIQDTSGFDHTQVASFFIADDQWRKQTEISMLGSWNGNKKVMSMQRSKIKDYASKVGQKLVYVFDFFNERFFYVELKEILMQTDLKEPFIAYEKGNPPPQFLTSEYEDDGSDVVDPDQGYKSFGDWEDYNEIFGELDL
jgi:hypothetical protein